MVYFTLPQWADKLLDWTLAVIWDTAFRVPLWFYLQCRWYFRPPPVQWHWTRHQYTWINLNRMRGGFIKAYRTHPIDPHHAASEPAQLLCDRLQCAVSKVACPALSPKIPRIGPLTRARDVVYDVVCPGFFLVPVGLKHLSFPYDAPAEPNELVVYYIVGGGYAGGHPLTLHTPFSLANVTGNRVFSINYRKSVNAAGAFPASLIDTLAGYRYLVEDLGFEPKNIILAGDSAGGNACLALTRYLGDLEDYGWSDLGQVGGMMINSPWADMTASFESYQYNHYFDLLGDLSTTFVPPHTQHFKGDVTNPYFSPALTPSGGFNHLARHQVSVYISVGSAEIFRDEIEALYAALIRDGVQTTKREVLGGVHSEFVFLGVDTVGGFGWSWSLLAADAAVYWRQLGER